MKATLFGLCILCSTAAFGQFGATISARTQQMQFETNPLHASFTPMAESQNLIGTSASTYTYAQGERPLWEVAVAKQETPLGDSARALRKEHETVKKAGRVFTN